MSSVMPSKTTVTELTQQARQQLSWKAWKDRILAIVAGDVGLVGRPKGMALAWTLRYEDPAVEELYQRWADQHFCQSSSNLLSIVSVINFVLLAYDYLMRDISGFDPGEAYEYLILVHLVVLLPFVFLSRSSNANGDESDFIKVEKCAACVVACLGGGLLEEQPVHSWLRHGWWKSWLTVGLLCIMLALVAKLNLRLSEWLADVDTSVLDEHDKELVLSSVPNFALATATILLLISINILISAHCDIRDVLRATALSIAVMLVTMIKCDLVPAGGFFISFISVLLSLRLAAASDLTTRHHYENIKEVEANYFRVRTELRDMHRRLAHQEHTQHEREAVEKALADAKDEIGVNSIPFSDLQLEKLIGKGAFGEVIKCDYHGTKVVLKRIPRNKITKGNMAIFREEIRTSSQLRHPNITMLIGASWDTYSNIGMVTEFVEMGSLYDVLHNPMLTLTWCDPLQRMAVGIAQGMTYLHAQHPPIVHRDFKSPNILVSNTFGCKITDFGTAEALKRTPSERVRDESKIEDGGLAPEPEPEPPRRLGSKLSSSAPVGSPLWMPPEIIAGEPYQVKSDVWSFGVVLVEMDKRELPYKQELAQLKGANAMYTIMERVEKGELKPAMGPDAPPSMRLLADRCLQRNPEDRPSFSEILEQLSHANMLHEAAISSFKHDIADKLGLWLDRNRTHNRIASQRNATKLQGAATRLHRAQSVKHTQDQLARHMRGSAAVADVVHTPVPAASAVRPDDSTRVVGGVGRIVHPSPYVAVGGGGECGGGGTGAVLDAADSPSRPKMDPTRAMCLEQGEASSSDEEAVEEVEDWV